MPISAGERNQRLHQLHLFTTHVAFRQMPKYGLFLCINKKSARQIKHYRVDFEGMHLAPLNRQVTFGEV
jgi:hypothetical protein